MLTQSDYFLTDTNVILVSCRFHEKGLIFLALNPGWVNTDLAGEGSGAYVSIRNMSIFLPAEDVVKLLIQNYYSISGSPSTGRVH